MHTHVLYAFGMMQLKWLRTTVEGHTYLKKLFWKWKKNKNKNKTANILRKHCKIFEEIKYFSSYTPSPTASIKGPPLLQWLRPFPSIKPKTHSLLEDTVTYDQKKKTTI